MKDPFHAGPITIAAMIILTMASISAPALLFTQTAIASTEGQGGTITTTDTTTPTAPNNATQRVAVGGGNITLSINQFSPQRVEIQPGQSVTFFAPQGSIEVHNIIFDLSNGTIISDIGVPFTLPSDVLGGEVPADVSEELVPAPPYNLGEPIIQNMTGGTQAIIGFNKVAFYPAVVDQNDNVVYLEEEEISRQMLQIEQAFQQGTPMPSPLSASYTMDGTERIVSSGIILDVNGFAALEELFPEEGGGGTASQEELRAEDNQGIMANSTTAMTRPVQSPDEDTITQQEEFGTEEEQILRSGESEQFPPPQFPFLDSFTVTFNEPGTYDYFCAFHPGMFGQVVVGSSSGGEGQTNQT